MSRVSWPLVLACLVVALILVDIGLVETNRSLQAEVSQRAQYIQQTAQIETLSREVVTALANLAIQNNDDQLRTLLAKHGITINPSAAGRTTITPPVTPGAKR